MIALDSSIVVATFGAWHEHHDVARQAATPDARLVAHSALEAYSVLTRLPRPFRVEPELAVEFLRRGFPGERFALDRAAQASAPERLCSFGVSGGAVYDGLIALTATAAGAEIVSLDRRAAGTYQRCGARVRLLG